jgi:hypothetical protein
MRMLDELAVVASWASCDKQMQFISTVTNLEAINIDSESETWSSQSGLLKQLIQAIHSVLECLSLKPKVLQQCSRHTEFGRWLRGASRVSDQIP